MTGFRRLLSRINVRVGALAGFRRTPPFPVLLPVAALIREKSLVNAPCYFSARRLHFRPQYIGETLFSYLR